MVELVVKRDGREVPFNGQKISDAITKAVFEVDGCIKPETAKIVSDIVNDISNINKRRLSVENIQDIVEAKLMDTNRKDIAKAYILYRNERTKIRNRNSEMMKVIGEKIMATNVQNQNANVDEHSFGGRKGEADSELMRRYALDYLLSKKSRENHLGNRIYIHDLDWYAVGGHNCLSIPFDKLLANGFNTRQTDVRPAQSINTAMQLVAVIFQLQSLQQFGGCSATHLDWTMIPYVRKSFYKHYRDGLKYVCNCTDEVIAIETDLANGVDAGDISIEDMGAYPNKNAYRYAMDMTVKETYQAVEGMFHNLK